MKSQSAGAQTSRAVEFQERLNYIVPEPEAGVDVDDPVIGNRSACRRYGGIENVTVSFVTI
jgi:hypothetical protein